MPYLRREIVKLAATKKHLRPYLVPLLKKASRQEGEEFEQILRDVGIQREVLTLPPLSEPSKYFQEIEEWINDGGFFEAFAAEGYNRENAKIVFFDEDWSEGTWVVELLIPWEKVLDFFLLDETTPRQSQALAANRRLRELLAKNIRVKMDRAWEVDYGLNEYLNEEEGLLLGDGGDYSPWIDIEHEVQTVEGKWLPEGLLVEIHGQAIS